MISSYLCSKIFKRSYEWVFVIVIYVKPNIQLYCVFLFFPIRFDTLTHAQGVYTCKLQTLKWKRSEREREKKTVCLSVNGLGLMWRANKVYEMLSIDGIQCLSVIAIVIAYFPYYFEYVFHFSVYIVHTSTSIPSFALFLFLTHWISK